LSIPFLRNTLIKTRSTVPQKTLRRYERLRNIKNSMGINKRDIEKIKDKCVIVIDDIMTTGATIKEAKRVLQKHGAKKIMSVVLAH
jgi:competence protein ComFC